MLSAGNFDIYAQADEDAIAALLKGLLAQLQAAGQARFQTSVGPFNLDLTLTALQVQNIRAVNPADRFAGTLASFVIKGDVDVSLTIAGHTVPLLQDHVEVDLDDLQVGVTTTPGGLPTGISLGFGRIGIQVKGLGFLTGLVNGLLNLITLIVRFVLAPLGLIPIPIYQMADVFVKLGILFAHLSPLVGPSLGRRGIVALADFQRNAPPHASNKNAVTDLIPPSSTLTAAAQINDRAANQAIAIGFQKGYFPSGTQVAGIFFAVVGLDVHFLNPSPPFTAKVGASAVAVGKIKKNLCGFFGSLFGVKKIKISIYASIVSDLEVVPKPAAPASSNLVFHFDATARAKVSIPAIYGIILGILLGPQIFILLLVLVQVLNIVANAVLPQTIVQINQSGNSVTVTLQHAQLGVGLFSITAQAQATGQGVIDLDPIARLATQKFPMTISFPADAIASQSLPSSAGQGDLLLGANLRP